MHKCSLPKEKEEGFYFKQ